MSNNGKSERPVQKLQPYEFELFNRKLKELYGQLEDGRPHFRLIWSEDVFEKRVMTHTDQGFPLTYPEVREVRKYRPQTRDKYVLEGLRAIPVGIETDLVELVSYEPVWTFMDKDGNYLIPTWKTIFFILETVKENQENAGKGIKYKDPDSDPKEAIENRKRRIDLLYEELFGNETPVTDALAYGRGVTVPELKGEN